MGWIDSARWHFGTTFCTYTISIPLAIAKSCHGDWLPALLNTYRNLPFLPAASRNPGHTASYHEAGWLPAVSNTYRNLPFLPAASQNLGHKTTTVAIVKKQNIVFRENRCPPTTQTILWWTPTCYFNSRHPQHWFSAQQKMQHLHISWRNPCIWSLDYQVLFLLLNGPQIETSLLIDPSISIDLWCQKVASHWFCPLPLKRGNL